MRSRNNGPATCTQQNAHLWKNFPCSDRNEIAHAFNSPSRRRNDKTFSAKLNGVIHQQWLCSNGHQMTLSAVSDRSRCYAWEGQQEIGFRKGTSLERSTMKCRIVVLFIYCWSKNLTTFKLSHTTDVDWKEFLRKIAPGGFYRFRKLSAPQVCTSELWKVNISPQTFHRATSSHQWISEGSAVRQKVPFHGPFHGNYWRHAPFLSPQ